MANRDHDEGEAKAEDGVSLFVRVTMYHVLAFTVGLVCLVAWPDGPHVRHL